jgi:hypothetical protein
MRRLTPDPEDEQHTIRTGRSGQQDMLGGANHKGRSLPCELVVLCYMGFDLSVSPTAQE